MRKIFVPLIFDAESFRGARDEALVGQWLPGCEAIALYPTLAAAKEKAKQLSMQSPKGKVVILESVLVIEPMKIEFSEKVYNASGELIV